MKFQFVGAVWGTAHATGYPGYTLAVGLFQHLLPLGTLAWRANLFSVASSVLAVQCLLSLLRTLGVRRGEATAAVLIFAVGRTLWTQATVAEVYALHEVFVIGTLGTLARWHAGTLARWHAGTLARWHEERRC